LLAGDSNRITNLEIWGNGEETDPASERSGVVINSNRNLISLVDSDRNYKHGFVIIGDYNILSNLMARNNGQSAIESYGYNFYNAHYNVLTSSIATDEQDTKTQDYGLAEGGTSDYNNFACLNLIGNQTGGISSTVGAHTQVHFVYNGTTWTA